MMRSTLKEIDDHIIHKYDFKKRIGKGVRYINILVNQSNKPIGLGLYVACRSFPRGMNVFLTFILDE